MPSNKLSIDSSFPRFQNGETTEQKVDIIQNYIYLLTENIQYALNNLDVSNMNTVDFDAYIAGITSPIAARIEDAEGNIAELQVTAQGLGVRITDAEGNISSLTQTAEGLSSRVTSAEGNISTLQQTASSLSSTVSSHTGSISTLQQTASSLSVSVSDLEDAQSTTLFMNSRGVVIKGTSGSVTISGSQLKAGTVIADEIRGSTFSLLDDDYNDAANFYLTGASSTTEPKIVIESGAIDLNSTSGDIFIEADASLQLYQSFRRIDCKGDFVPSSSGTYDLGGENFLWNTVYCQTCDPTGSDERIKNSIETVPQKYIDMLDLITPRIFKYNNGTSGRIHAGFIAQDVKRQMDANNISDMEFAGWIQDKSEENGTQMVRYGEFIPLLLAKVQQIDARMKALEGTA